jgi:hypothetical protein
MIEVFVYLGLLLDGDARDDRTIWSAALEAVLAELGAQPPAPAVAGTVAALDDRLRGIAARAQAGAPLAELRPAVADARRRLFRLAADWAGALANP